MSFAFDFKTASRVANISTKRKAHHSPLLIGREHKFLWQQELNIDVEVYLLSPKFGEVYCIHCVDIDTSAMFPKVYIPIQNMEALLEERRRDNDAVRAEMHIPFNKRKEIVKLLTNGLKVDNELHTIVLPKMIQGQSRLCENLGSPSVRGKKRASFTNKKSILDFKEFQETLALETKLWKESIQKADKHSNILKMSLMTIKQESSSVGDNDESVQTTEGRRPTY